MKVLTVADRFTWGIGLAAALFAADANAQFDALERFGGVSIGASIEFQDYDFTKTLGEFNTLSVHNSGFDPLEAAGRLKGLELSTLVASATAAGRSAQHSEYDGTTLRFEGQTDISLNGYANAGALFGNGSATTVFESTFNVNETTATDLFMSSIMNSVDNAYAFSLVRHDGTVVWDRVSIESAQGLQLFTYTQRLDLAPGSYTLNASLKALSSVDPGSLGGDSNVAAEFTLRATPIPEAGSAAMLLLGLVSLGLIVRRCNLPRPTRLMPAFPTLTFLSCSSKPSSAGKFTADWVSAR